MTGRLANILPLLLITLLCISGVELFYLGVERFLLGSEPTPQVARDIVEPVGPAVEKSSARSGRIDYSVITRRNLFGPPPQNNAVLPEEPIDTEELEQTTLEVVLMGTIGGGSSESRAIILSKKDRTQELYRVGDSVQGASIKRIDRGRVILSYNGRDEMLDMSEAADYAPRTARPVSASSVTRPQAVIPAPIGGEEIRPREAVKTRVVRPTRRIVRPRQQATAEDVIEGDEADIDSLEAIELPGEG